MEQLEPAQTWGTRSSSLGDLWQTKLEPTEVQEALRVLERAVATVSSGITIADALQPDKPLIYCNEAFSEITGYTPEDVLGKNCRFLQGPDTDPAAVHVIREAVKQGAPCSVVFKNYRKDRTPFWNELTITPVFATTGELTHFIGVQHDISARQEAQDELGLARAELLRVNRELEERVRTRTLELERANEQLQHDAFHDALTGLANRALFDVRLAHTLELEKRDPENLFAVLYLDFDRFKFVNDTLGHALGDELLVAIAQRLKCCTRPSDTVARLGGDEFTVLIENLSGLDEATDIVERIQRELSPKFVLCGRDIYLTASLGLTVSSVGYNTADEVLRDADIAMYTAKRQGKARCVRFDASLRASLLRKSALEADLRNALATDELVLHYQPIVAADTGVTNTLEALVRWQHPAHGTISPGEFIPIAEESGLITKLDRWVLQSACRQLAIWYKTVPNSNGLSVNVNMSSQSFEQPGLPRLIEDLLFECGLPASALHLELTETDIARAEKVFAANVAALRALGLGLHIDDFGTGYSSLSYLQNLPSDTLKIDQSFIARMLTSPESGELVRTIITMAKNLGLRVVAEGVESAEQLVMLKRLGCDYVQGFYLSKPLPTTEVERFIE